MNNDTPRRRTYTRRQMRLIALAWIALSGLVVMCIFLASNFAIQATAEAVQAVEPPPSPTLPAIQPLAAGEFGYGIQMRGEVGDINTTIALVNQLDLNWVKQQVRWAQIQPTSLPEEDNWEQLDAIIAESNANGLNVLLSVVAAPDWTRPATPGRTGPPEDLQLYADFVATLLERYPGQVQAIEVWNEQNIQREWYAVGGLSAARYVEMLRLTYDTVQDIDPSVKVISGALAPTGVDDGITAIDDFRYMDQMIQAGLLDYADCIGAHHTGINLPPDVSSEEAFAAGPPADATFLGPYDAENPLNPHHSWSFWSTLRGQHALVANAGGSQRLCVTQFGWPSMEGTGLDEAPAGFAFAWDNSLAEQSEYDTQAFQLLREWGIAEMAILWNLDFAPKTGGPLDDNALFSLLNPDGTARPVFQAIADMPKQ